MKAQCKHCGSKTEHEAMTYEKLEIIALTLLILVIVIVFFVVLMLMPLMLP